MLSIFCNTSLLRRPLLSVHLVESLAQCSAQDQRHVSTSATSFNSGRFRKIKPVTSSFLSRSSVKQIKETSNPAFGREFLDKTVEKLLQGKPKYFTLRGKVMYLRRWCCSGENKRRYKFLTKKSPPSLEPDNDHPRENIIQDWNHIHETVLNLGVPEFADVIGGQMFAGGHLRFWNEHSQALLCNNYLFPGLQRPVASHWD